MITKICEGENQSIGAQKLSWEKNEQQRSQLGEEQKIAMILIMINKLSYHIIFDMNLSTSIAR